MFLVAAFCGYSVPAIAHEQKAAITSVVFNQRTDSVEVAHRFSLHDAEHAVKRVLDKDADIIASAQTRARFAEYVYQHFSIKLDSGEPLTLAPIGFELEGRFFWVYQEAPIPTSKTAWHVQHNALQEIWPSQINTVNIETGVQVKTLTFNADTGTQIVSFDI